MALYPVEGLRHFWIAQPEEELSFEELLPEISARLVSLPTDEVDRGIEEALRLICNSEGIDESTIYLREIENPDIFILSYVLRDPALTPPHFVSGTDIVISGTALAPRNVTGGLSVSGSQKLVCAATVHSLSGSTFNS